MQTQTQSTNRSLLFGATLLAMTSAFAGTANAGGKSTIYDAAGTKEKPARIIFYENGNVKELIGVRTFCSRDCEAYDGWKIEVAGLGLIEVGNGTPSPLTGITPPDQVSYIDDFGDVIDIYGVKVVLKRDTSWDKELADIAGNPADAKFFAYSSERLGPDMLGNELPLSMYFQQVFQYLDEDNSIKLSDLGGDPYVVTTNTGDDATAPVTPVVTRISVTRDVVGLEANRLGTPANPDVFEGGLSGVPILGRSWDPYVQVFSSSNSTDILFVNDASRDVFVPGRGTLLIGGNTLYSQTVGHGSSFAMPIPVDNNLLGYQFFSQVANIDGSTIQLTNAIDGIIGATD